MNKRYQVFVSSTFADLKEERKLVIQTLMEMDCIPAGMELFPAIDEEQWQFIKSIIDDCDYYLIIVGGRYGSIAPDGISYTEKEYDYAIEKGMKVIALVHENPDSIPAGNTDQNDTAREKLSEFIEKKLKKGRLVKFWSSDKDLPGLVAVNLAKTIKVYPAVGWVRSGSAASPELLSELNALRKENDILKSTAHHYESSEFNVPNLASLDDEFSFQVSIAGGESDSLSLSWSEVFAALSKKLLSSADESLALDELNAVIKRKMNLTNDDFYFDESILEVIKIQFIAHNLFDEDGGWYLTSKGKKMMIELNAIRKKNT
ncbi:DUF4062 domain-containing protein [Vibrio parahaemolyticus]|uniref:DUF4062 domain-containing protein n=4 Tax=Vibrio parahaemolyticus TaxID=670 RepID=A0A7Z2MTV9_VIBPH|nr:DUF4062 domain-containing protein [Vibrio parahaemolyticus]EJG0874854.1 DUF4062 domain-containing protein [Vibrio parahaemolyticus O3]EJG0904148.1 DUF4062 domain-containing protein [Vibrio parahaemolyticus O3:K56]EJG1076993.1 DUF4062 domain-containing protein [Vibrio parahaemolyticus O1:K56]EGQ8275910.1 DUF4062 domain-containing protein [Vibrio parahaemolyticus]EGQ8941666.1 DUF4062 domain-containing protein [Vibrio parahaemolyticus]